MKHNNSEELVGIFSETFARHGIPDQLVTDNGSQYKSKLFHDFVKEWKFEHCTSSPFNSQSNGKAESAVKTAKRLLVKCQETRQNFHLALLNQRNTPSEGTSSTPVQRLMHRRTKMILPTKSSRLKEIYQREDEHKLKENK